MFIFYTALLTLGVLPTAAAQLTGSLSDFSSLYDTLSLLASDSSYTEFLTSADNVASFLTSLATEVGSAQAGDLADSDGPVDEAFSNFYSNLQRILFIYEDFASLKIGDKWSVDPSPDKDSPLYSEQLGSAINMVQYAFATFYASYANKVGCEAIYSSIAWAQFPGDEIKSLYQTYSNPSYSNSGQVDVLAWPTITTCHSAGLAIVPPGGTANATNSSEVPITTNSSFTETMSATVTASSNETSSANETSTAEGGSGAGVIGSVSGSEGESGQETSAGSSSTERTGSEGSGSSSESASDNNASSAAGSSSHAERSSAGGSSAAASSGSGSGSASSNGANEVLSASVLGIGALIAFLI